MGLFDAFKQTFNVGGVDVQVQAPATASLDAVIPVTVTMTTKSPQSVKGVTVQLVRSSRNQTGGTSTTAETQLVTLAQMENTEAFQIAPGETKTLQFNLSHNAGAALQAALPQDNPLAQGLAGVLKGIETVANTMNAGSYRYAIKAVADVEGAAFDPSKEVDIQMMGPGQIGGGVNLHT